MTDVPDEVAAYERVEHDGRVALLHPKHSGALGDLFFGAGIGHEYKQSDGRGAVYTFDIDGGKGILRPYRRGGVLARFRQDRYWRDNRPMRELAVLHHAYTRGLPVPEPLGIIYEQHGKSFSGAIATRIVKAQTLEQWARYMPPEDEVADTLRRTGEAIRAIHDAGIYHADLQIRNILVDDNAITLIDFDNATQGPALGDFQRAQNLLRLRRSISKNGLPIEWYTAILSSYGDVSIPPWLALAYRVKGSISSLIGAT